MKSIISARRVRVGAALAAAAMITLPAINNGTATAKAVPTTPIQHVVVIFQENVSFDHYFATYPNATNSSGQPFYPAKGTKSVNGLSGSLLTANPNGANPRRLDPAVTSDVLTCDQDHDYTDEQSAFDNGAMDKFVADTGTGSGNGPTGQPCQASDVMNYYDGNTVTGLWNYAQHFAMSDNSFGTTFGPSSPGAINLASGDTGGVSRAIKGAATDGDVVADGKGGYSLISDAQPFYDDCSTRDAAALSGHQHRRPAELGRAELGLVPGRLPAGRALLRRGRHHPLVRPGVGFAGEGRLPRQPSRRRRPRWHRPVGDEGRLHPAPRAVPVLRVDGQPAPPGAGLAVGHRHRHGHARQVRHGQPPVRHERLRLARCRHPLRQRCRPAHCQRSASSRRPGYEDGHAAYSDPIDEQNFVVDEINALEQTPDWSSTAVIVAYDDSDGFYDHVFSGVRNPSQTEADTLTGANQCGTGTDYLGGEQGRCGLGPRLPLLVISPWAKSNFVAHNVTDQSSITKFIEQNWNLGHIPGSFATVAGSINTMFDFHHGGSNPVLYLNPATGQPALVPPSSTPH